MKFNEWTRDTLTNLKFGLNLVKALILLTIVMANVNSISIPYLTNKDTSLLLKYVHPYGAFHRVHTAPALYDAICAPP